MRWVGIGKNTDSRLSKHVGLYQFGTRNYIQIGQIKFIQHKCLLILSEFVIIRKSSLYCQYNNFPTFMSAQQEDFELLISTEDYLRLQTKCHELQEAQQNLNKQNRQMSLKIFDLKEQNAELLKKIAQLTDNTKYLSQKGIEMSKTLMDLELESNTLKTSMVQTQKQMAIKYKESLASLKQVETKLLDMIKQNSKIKDDLKQKSSDLQKIKNIQKCSRHIQFSPNLIQKSISTTLTIQELQTQKQKKSQLETSCSNFKTQIQDLKTQISNQKVNIKQLQNNIQKLSQDLKSSKNENQVLGNKLVNQSQQEQKLKCQLTKITQKLNEANKKQKQLTQQKNNLQKKLTETKNYVDKASSDLSAIIAQSKKLSSEKQTLEKGLEDNSKKVANFESQNITLKQKIANSQNQTKKYITSLQQQNVKCEALLKQIKAAQCKINQQKQKVKESTQKSNSLTKQLLSMKESLVQKQKTTKQIMVKLDETTKNLNEQRSKYSNLQKKYKQYQNAKQQLQSKIVILNKQANDYKQASEQNKALSSNSQGIICALTTQNKNLTEKIQQAIGQKQKLSNELQKTQNQLQKRIKQVVQENSKLFQQSFKKESQLKNSLASFDEKQSDIKNLQSLIKRLQEQTAIQNFTIIQLKQKIKVLQNEKATIIQESNNNIAALKDQLIKVNESKETMEKQYQDIILSMDLQKQGMNKSKSKDKPQRDQLKEIKGLIEEYFTNLALNLYEVGNLDPQDIRGILRQQQEIVRQYVSDVMGPFIQQKKLPLPPVHHPRPNRN